MTTKKLSEADIERNRQNALKGAATMRERSNPATAAKILGVGSRSDDRGAKATVLFHSRYAPDAKQATGSPHTTYLEMLTDVPIKFWVPLHELRDEAARARDDKTHKYSQKPPVYRPLTYKDQEVFFTLRKGWTYKFKEFNPDGAVLNTGDPVTAVGLRISFYKKPGEDKIGWSFEVGRTVPLSTLTTADALRHVSPEVFRFDPHPTDKLLYDDLRAMLAEDFPKLKREHEDNKPVALPWRTFFLHVDPTKTLESVMNEGKPFVMTNYAYLPTAEAQFSATNPNPKPPQKATSMVIRGQTEGLPLMFVVTQSSDGVTFENHQVCFTIYEESIRRLFILNRDVPADKEITTDRWKALGPYIVRGAVYDFLGNINDDKTGKVREGEKVTWLKGHAVFNTPATIRNVGIPISYTVANNLFRQMPNGAFIEHTAKLISDDWSSAQKLLTPSDRAFNLNLFQGSVTRLQKEVEKGNVTLHVLCDHRLSDADLKATHTMSDDGVWEVLKKIRKDAKTNDRNPFITIYAVSSAEPIREILLAEEDDDDDDDDVAEEKEEEEEVNPKKRAKVEKVAEAVEAVEAAEEGEEGEEDAE